MKYTMTHPLLTLFQEQSSLYRLKEIWDGTHDFTKRTLEWVFWIAPKSSLVSETSLFGESLYDNFYIFEWSRKQWASARWDFRCKINGQLVVVETERLDNIEAGMKQIGGYMTAENTNFGIVTDGGIWRFFKHGADHLDQYETLTIEQLCSTDGQAFLQNFYNSYDFYLQRLSSVESKPFDTQIFHQWLITTAERIVFDLRHIGLFTGSSQEVAKEEIQTAYSLIIQILLIKIVQDKRKINLLKKDIIIDKLKEQDRNGIFEAVEGQLNWLGDFYKPYHNQQDTLLNTIIAHYQQWSRIAKLNLDSVRLFLDLYHFIYSFDFKDVKQDLFGAVYENYLKELYKDDDTKKWQVFTPPEIVEFMLDEVGYTVDYIQKTIITNLPILKEHLEDSNFNIDGLSLIDPACGSGTFLYKSAGRIVNALYNIRKDNKIDDNQAGKIAELLICNNIVGFDIEPFPLYLAEMNILQSLLFFNVSADGNVINSIDQPIKIFSTHDSIAEFHNLESSMEKDLSDLINGWDFATLASKRDPKSILQLKADLQDFDTVALMTKFQLALYHKALQNEFFIIDSGELITTKSKTYRDKHHKKITTLTTIPDLLAYVRETLDDKYLGLFESNIKSLKTPLDHIRSKLWEIISKTQTKRTKFDFVVANPPYVRTVAFYDNDDLYGININDRKYTKIYIDWGEEMRIWSSKFNIYGYFYYLWFFLLKDWWKMSFINPRTFLFQPSFHKLRQFIKHNFSLHKLIDFNNWIVFYDRGINGRIEVITDACITLITKSPQDISHKVDVLQYTGKERLVNLETFKNNNSWIIKKDISEIVDYKWYRFFHYFKELQTNDSDFHFSIYSRIDKEKISEEKIWLPVIKPKWYYTTQADALWYFDYENIWAVETYPTCEAIIEKKYKISRWSLTMLRSIETKKEHWIDFVFTDYKRLNQRDRFTSLWVSKEENIPELYYLFWMFNSHSCQRQFIEEFGTNVNKTNLSLLKFPLLNTPTKLALKSDLITNSEAIITLCKQWSSWYAQTRWDICETVFDPDSLWEKITGLKAQYIAPLTKGGYRGDPKLAHASDPLPDDILALLSSEITDLAKLEAERDEIVKQLYELG